MRSILGCCHIGLPLETSLSLHLGRALARYENLILLAVTVLIGLFYALYSAGFLSGSVSQTVTGDAVSEPTAEPEDISKEKPSGIFQPPDSFSSGTEQPVAGQEKTSLSSGGGGGSKIDNTLQQVIADNPEQKTEVIFHVPEGQSLNDVSAQITQAGGEVSGTYSIGNMVIARVPNNKIESLVLEAPITKAWPEREVQVLDENSSAQINAQQAWSAGYNGSSVKVAVLDTGIDSSHEMLKGKVILEKDFTGNNPKDVFGHGTHVAGIIAGNGNYKGVAPGALLLNGKVLNDKGSGSDIDVIRAINWAVDPDSNNETDDGAEIISMSLGGLYSDPFGPISLAVKGATERGVIVVAASGNCGPCGSCGGFKGVTTPGSSPYAITVGAVDENNQYACFSSGEVIKDVGVKPDLTAPGKNILSSVPGGYATKSGTSMSTPHIAGAIALLLQVNSKLNQSGVKQILESFSADLGVPGKDIQFGSGLVDIGRISYLRVIPEPAVIEYSNSSTAFKIWNFAGKNITVKNVTCENCTVNFTSEIVVQNEKYAQFNLTVGEFTANLPINIKTDITNVTIIVTKLFETGPEITYEYWNSTIRPLRENGTANPDISALALDIVYCDWADNGGNSYCMYRGKWKNLQSRNNPNLGMKPGEYYYIAGDKTPGDNGGRYEEEDAYATVGSVSEVADLTKININYAAGAMDKKGNFGGCGILEPGNCDVTNVEVSCNGNVVVDKDPCTFCPLGICIPWFCNNFQDSTTCTPAKNSAYQIKITANIKTKDADNDIVTVIRSDVDYLDIKCTKDSDCGGNGKCKFATNRRSTFCEYSNDCTNGATECTSATKKRTCGDYDGNGYTEWGAPAACSPVAACHPNSCVSSLINCPDCDLVAGNNYIKWTAQLAASDAAFASIKDKLQETLYIGSDDKWASNPAAVVNDGIYTLKMSSSGTLKYAYCGDNVCSSGETMDSCSSDCGKKHSYSKFPSGWSADISSFDSQAYFGKDYSLNINYKCSSDGYVYFPLDLAKDSSGKFTCGDPPHDTGCQNEVLVKSYFSSSDCNNAWKEKTLTFKIPSGSNPGQYSLWIGFWHGYDSGTTPKIDGSDGGYHSSSGPKTVTVSEWKCTSNSQCSAEEYCSSEGTCKKDVCAPQGQNYCKDNNVYACSSDGSSESLAKSCSSDEICQSASCVPKIVCGNNKCEAGETTSCPKDCLSPCNDYCSKDVKYFDGKWINSKCSYSSELCTYGCFNGKCLAQSEFPFTMSIESASEKITAYKQPGDYVTIVFNSKNTQTIDFSPPSVLNYVSGPYSAGKVNLASGKTSVAFQISEDARGNHPISASNTYTKTPVLWLSIINEPEFLIITDKTALQQRFAAEEAKVSTLLQETYSLAGKYGTGVVYDLSDYKAVLGSRPWAKFDEYREKPLEPEKKDNAYATNVAEFIQKKCKSCRNVMILGDDFVVPMYRVDYKQFTGWELPIFNVWIFNNPQTKNIYSDFAYVPRDVRPVSDLNTIFESIRQDKGEKVVIIKPDGKSYPEIDKLKSVLMSKFSIKSSSFAEYESKDIACNEYGKLRGHTLILIGDRQSNNAIKCVPWFDAGKKPGDTFKASVTLERNVWSDKSDYAVILSGDENSAIATLTDFLQNPGYYSRNFMSQTQTAYIHEFSKPKEIITSSDYFQGFVLGQCEHVGESFIEQSPCIASDVTISFLPGIGAVTDIRDAAIYCFAAIRSSENMDRLLCGAAGGGALTSIGTVVAAGTVIGAPVAAASEAADVTLATTKGILKTLKAAMKSSKAFEKIAKILKLTDADSIKKFFKLGSGEGIEVAQKRINIILTGPYRKSALNALGELDESALKNGIKNVDELENAVRGTETVLGSYKSLDDIPLLKGCLKTASIMVTAGVCSPDLIVKFMTSLGYAQNLAGVTSKSIKKPDFVEMEKNVLARYFPKTGQLVINTITNPKLLDYSDEIMLHEAHHAKIVEQYVSDFDWAKILKEGYELAHVKSFSEVLADNIAHLKIIEAAKKAGKNSDEAVKAYKNLIKIKYPIKTIEDAEEFVNNVLFKSSTPEVIIEAKATLRIFGKFDPDLKKAEEYIDQVLKKRFEPVPSVIVKIDTLTGKFVARSEQIYQNAKFAETSAFKDIMNEIAADITDLRKVL